MTRHLSVQTMVPTMVSSCPEVNYFYCSHSLPTRAAPVTPVSQADRSGEYKSERARVTANSRHLTLAQTAALHSDHTITQSWL